MNRLCAFLACLFLLIPVIAPQSQTTTADTNTTGDTNNSGTKEQDQPWYYLSDGESTFNLPSGVLGINANASPTLFPTTPVATTPTADDISNLQGCGGVGQSDYTSALFNMPEVFDKFKRDVNSELAKQLLTYNYSLPQTAALFDTLNSYGNARYQQFQSACKLDALKQDAKNQYMAACVKERYPERKALVQKALNNAKQNNNAGSEPQAPAGALKAPNGIQDSASEDQINAQAYAQAWEICALQYTNDDKAIALRKDQNSKFITTLRSVENVNVAIRPLLCPPAQQAEGDSTVNTNTANACWINLFIPQVRLCNGPDLSTGCTPTSDYGVKEPVIGVAAYFDLLRYLMANGVVNDLVDTLSTELDDKRIDEATQKLAARDATNNLALVKRPPTTPNDETTKQFQQGYLSCTSSDIAYPLNQYRAAINRQTAPAAANGTTNNANGTTTTNNNNTNQKNPVGIEENLKFGIAEYRALMTDDVLTLPTSLANEKEALIGLTEVALGCTANQVVPIFDPNITVSLETQCDVDDWNAFYTVSSYDVSVGATRDIYRFVSLRLKQAYARLLNEKGAGIPQTTTAADGTTTAVPVPVDSPELRERLARAIKEVMLPSIDAQILRLEEMEKVRGAFGHRVNKIYSDKQGCVGSSFTPFSTQAMPPAQGF